MTSAKVLPCGHIFHYTCLRSWLEQSHSCPVCRASLVQFEASRPPLGTHQLRRTGRRAAPTPADRIAVGRAVDPHVVNAATTTVFINVAATFALSASTAAFASATSLAATSFACAKLASARLISSASTPALRATSMAISKRFGSVAK